MQLPKTELKEQQIMGTDSNKDIGITVSIIEDNKVIRDNLVKYLEFTDDMKVKKVIGSVEGFFHEISNDPNFNCNVLLLDIGLPGMSGLEAIPILSKRVPDMDIIMLTTYEEEQVILRALCSGAVAYLSKKTGLSEICEAIRIVKKGGSYMSPSIAREIVTHLMGGKVTKTTILSNRQESILKLLVEGISARAIGEELNISYETVRTHIKRMYKVLQVNNKAEAISKYLRGEIK